MSDDLRASRLFMSQWPNSTGAHRICEATQFSISPAPASTSRASKKAEKGLHAVGSVQPIEDGGALIHRSSPQDRNEEGDPELLLDLEERDKEGDEFTTICGNETRKETLLVAPS
jgi:hypothetical protein